MSMTAGFNHVATVTADLDRVVGFYRAVFAATVTFEMAATADHPRMAVLDLGGGSALNITEQPADTIVGDRATSGHRGPIDHYGIAVANRAAVRELRDRLVAAGADVGDIQRLGGTWSLFFRDPDGMELEVCAPVRSDDGAAAGDAEAVEERHGEGRIRALVASVQAAQSMVEPFLELHTAETLVVNFGGRRVLGRADLRQAMEAAMASPLAEITTTTEVHDIRFVRPDVAIVSCTKHVDDRRGTPDALATRGSLTYVAVEDDGEWRIALAQTTPIAGA